MQPDKQPAPRITYRDGRPEKAAEERLARARTAFEDAATRLRDAVLSPCIMDEDVEAFDAARLELEQAKKGGAVECYACGEAPGTLLGHVQGVPQAWCPDCHGYEYGEQAKGGAE